MLPDMGYSCHSLETLTEYDFSLLRILLVKQNTLYIPSCDRRRGLKVMFITLIKPYAGAV